LRWSVASAARYTADPGVNAVEMRSNVEEATANDGESE
jgi:hypothetical protein